MNEENFHSNLSALYGTLLLFSDHRIVNHNNLPLKPGS